MNIHRMIVALRCKICSKEYLWCWKRGKDFRCDKCREEGTTVAEIEKELEEMSEEEYRSFMDDIAEYNKNLK